VAWRPTPTKRRGLNRLTSAPKLRDPLSWVLTAGLWATAGWIGSTRSILFSMTVSFAQLATEFWVTGRKERLLYRFLSLSSIWVIAGQLIYWQADTLAGLILTGPFQAVAFGCLLLLFTFLGVREQISPQDPPHFIPREWLRALPFLALALLMFPLVLYIPMGEEFAHHWSFYTGPAELVRAGGWLLHDVPSQYGFLNIALLAALPGANSFQNLYFITALTCSRLSSSMPSGCEFSPPALAGRWASR